MDGLLRKPLSGDQLAAMLASVFESTEQGAPASPMESAL